MGVPNSRECNYYHAPNAPLKILLRSKYGLFYFQVNLANGLYVNVAAVFEISFVESLIGLLCVVVCFIHLKTLIHKSEFSSQISSLL